MWEDCCWFLYLPQTEPWRRIPLLKLLVREASWTRERTTPFTREETLVLYSQIDLMKTSLTILKGMNWCGSHEAPWPERWRPKAAADMAPFWLQRSGDQKNGGLSSSPNLMAWELGCRWCKSKPRARNKCSVQAARQKAYCLSLCCVPLISSADLTVSFWGGQ